MSEKVSFTAAFPAIQAAIKLDGAGGARIQLDIPESEMGRFIPAMMWRGQRLMVTIQPSMTDFDDEAKRKTEKATLRVGRRRPAKR